MAQSEAPEGYPDSPPDETAPPGPPLPLEAADRELAEEGEIEAIGPPPGDDVLEDRLADAPDADQLAAIELGDGGSRPEDAPNFEDNLAEWSRERQ
jgi:hypothetical protein